jgi:hypothetical protein
MQALEVLTTGFATRHREGVPFSSEDRLEGLAI